MAGWSLLLVRLLGEDASAAPTAAPNALELVKLERKREAKSWIRADVFGLRADTVTLTRAAISGLYAVTSSLQVARDD